jgi:predicted AlkP superfamily pyrophosphatase or phosphodiesterase
MIRLTLLLVLLFNYVCSAQDKTQSKPSPLNNPKLVVGIVVDQMRYDYLFRYWDKYSDSGFKKLINDGFLCKNVHYNYIPTYTAPGHASVYTGTTPSVHGIVSNDWYDRVSGKNVYCTTDSTVNSIGASGKMSPRNLFATTMTDELRLATGKLGKVIGIALKDRSAILPAGHMANAAYWFDGPSGNWVSSTYYFRALPAWVPGFNTRKLQDQYLSKPWETLLPLEKYTESIADDNVYEEPFITEPKPVFPHNLPAIRKSDTELLKRTPFGNTITVEFAMAAIKGEELGGRNTTDFLCISFSSTDYVGHQFGIDAIETQDTYMRLDKDLAEFLAFLESRIGKENLLVFLTADHGAAHNTGYLKEQKVPAGVIDATKLGNQLEMHLDSAFGAGRYIAAFSSYDLYLNDSIFKSGKLSRKEIENAVKIFLKKSEGVAEVYSADELNDNGDNSPRSMLTRGAHPLRKADIYYVMQPNWMDYTEKGTTHGSGYDYDTHVPLLFWGGKIPHDSSVQYHSITDIAPTVCTYLNIPFPNGCTGNVITEIFRD